MNHQSDTIEHTSDLSLDVHNEEEQGTEEVAPATEKKIQKVYKRN
jgi:hypothetical protein